MAADFSASIWWCIRRSHGPIIENSLVSRRGYLMAQYSKFVLPGYRRITAPTRQPDVYVTAYTGDATHSSWSPST